MYKIRSLFLGAIFFVFSNLLFGKEFITQNNKSVFINNGIVNRTIELNKGMFITKGLWLNDSLNFYVPENSKEFCFMANNREYSGLTGWEWKAKKLFTEINGGQGIQIKLIEKSDNPEIEIEVNYVVYENLPLIRKWLNIKNIGNNEIKIENLNIEDFISNLSLYTSTVHHNYARETGYAHYVGSYNDPVMVVHNTIGRFGLALGNEAMGVIKRTAYNTGKEWGKRNNVEIGLTKVTDDYPFRKWINPGEQWASPKVFMCLYQNRDDAFEVINEEVNRFMIMHMQPKIIINPKLPSFIFNTWEPFNCNFNDTLIHQLINISGECGADCFTIDVGWHKNINGKSAYDYLGEFTYGDWQVDNQKFPNGLEPIVSQMNKSGMTPGLWLTIGSVSNSSKVYKENPEWVMIGKDGKPIFLQNIQPVENPEVYSTSMGTEWKEYIKEKILYYVKKYNVRYLKLDYAVVTSAYIFDPERAGSYAFDHPYYKDRNESFYVLYQRLLELFDELHEAEPNLFIDCTYEAAGRHHFTDYAIAQHAEGNWISNFNEPSPTGPLRIRHLAWSLTPAMPASSLIIGNFRLDDPDYEFGLKSLIGTMPIFLGDLRKLTSDKKENIKNWANWVRKMHSKHGFLHYRKDLEGFGEPRIGSWDGWQRINFQSHSGGVVGVFKQGGSEKSRTVVLKDLLPEKYYEVRMAPLGALYHSALGKELMESGFQVFLEQKFDGKIFEVEISNSK